MKQPTHDDQTPEAPGDWRVDHDCCVACGAPPLAAPDLMGFGTRHSGTKTTQCYFKRQPVTPDEIDRACDATNASCVSAVLYEGPDEAIRARVTSTWSDSVKAEVVDSASVQRRFRITALAVTGACVATLLWLALR